MKSQGSNGTVSYSHMRRSNRLQRFKAHMFLAREPEMKEFVLLISELQHVSDAGLRAIITLLSFCLFCEHMHHFDVVWWL